MSALGVRRKGLLCAPRKEGRGEGGRRVVSVRAGWQPLSRRGCKDSIVTGCCDCHLHWAEKNDNIRSCGRSMRSESNKECRGNDFTVKSSLSFCESYKYVRENLRILSPRFTEWPSPQAFPLPQHLPAHHLRAATSRTPQPWRWRRARSQRCVRRSARRETARASMR